MDSKEEQRLADIRAERHGRNKVRRLHHHAIRTDDMVATRAFYEGILGLPLVGTWKEGFDPVRGKPSPYLHCFFELGDGSAMAFFMFKPGEREKPPLLPQDTYDHHISLHVGNIEDLKYLRDRLVEAGYKHAVMDHGYCYSIYTRDPNGMTVELTCDPVNSLEISEAAAVKAEAELQKWIDGDYSVNNDLREYPTSPIEVSTLEQLMEIVTPDNWRARELLAKP